MERRFARLSSAPELPPGASAVPDAGMCLSVFLVLRSADDAHRVLMGRVNPNAPWWEIGAIDPGRLERVGRSWMLPSRQLLFFEGFEEAARAIARDQLGVDAPALSGPQVFSDPARRPGSESRDPHWDLHFVFEGRWPAARPPSHPAWTELAFVDVPRTSRTEMARGQGDVLELIGLVPAD